ncbi:hypothetical protein AVEN_179264-1, partial [Araneus ventricosus]
MLHNIVKYRMNIVEHLMLIGDSDMETEDGAFMAINGLCPTPSADDTFSHHSG